MVLAIPEKLINYLPAGLDEKPEMLLLPVLSVLSVISVILAVLLIPEKLKNYLPAGLDEDQELTVLPVLTVLSTFPCFIYKSVISVSGSNPAGM